MGEQKQREKYYASRIKSNLTHRLQCVKAAQGEAEREEVGEGGQQTHFNEGSLNALSMRVPSPPPPPALLPLASVLCAAFEFVGSLRLLK